MCSSGQKVVIPKGLVQPDETIIIEIPAELQNADTIVAMPKCPAKCPASAGLSKSFPKPTPKNYPHFETQQKYQRRSTQNAQGLLFDAENDCRFHRTLTPERPLHRVGKPDEEGNSPAIIKTHGKGMYRPPMRNRQVRNLDMKFSPFEGEFRPYVIPAGSTPQPADIDFIEGPYYCDFQRPKAYATPDGAQFTPKSTNIPTHYSPGDITDVPRPTPKRAESAPCTPENFYAMPPRIGGSVPKPEKSKPPTPCPRVERSSDYYEYEDSGEYEYEYEECEEEEEPSGYEYQYYPNESELEARELSGGYTQSPSRKYEVTEGATSCKQATDDDLMNSLAQLESCETAQIMEDVVRLQEARRQFLLDAAHLTTAQEISQELAS